MIFAFCDTILLGCVSTSPLRNNPLLLQKNLEFVGNILLPLVRAEGFDACGKMLVKLNPCESIMIINECNKIFIMGMRKMV